MVEMVELKQAQRVQKEERDGTEDRGKEQVRQLLPPGFPASRFTSPSQPARLASAVTSRRPPRAAAHNHDYAGACRLPVPKSQACQLLRARVWFIQTPYQNTSRARSRTPAVYNMAGWQPAALAVGTLSLGHGAATSLPIQQLHRHLLLPPPRPQSFPSFCGDVDAAGMICAAGAGMQAPGVDGI